MIKVYRSIEYPQCWIAYGPETGWVVFPARMSGWEERKPAHGLDPLHLRQAAVSEAAETGLTQTGAIQPRHTRTYAKVA